MIVVYITLARGKYNIKPYSAVPGTWISFNTDTENYVTNSVTETNKTILLTTGASEYTNKMNIYDFAGNEFEWALEHATTYANLPCSGRGGNFCNNGNLFPASDRGHSNTVNSGNGIGLRVSLY